MNLKTTFLFIANLTILAIALILNVFEFTYQKEFVIAILILGIVFSYLFYAKHKKMLKIIEQDLEKINNSHENLEKFECSSKNIRELTNIYNQLRRFIDKEFWYTAMLDAIPFPISVTDMDMNWTFFNKPAVDIMGKERAEFIGKQCNNWGADICKTQNCGIEMLRKNTKMSFFTQPGVDMDFQVDTEYLTDQSGEKIGHIEVVQDVSKSKRSAVYNQNEIERLSKNLDLIAQGNLDIDSDIKQPDKYTQKEYNNFKTIYENLNTAVGSIKNLVKDTNTLSESAKKGELSKRADDKLHKGVYKKVIEGFNQTLDLVISPINIASGYLSDLSKGKIPKLIVNNYKGDFKKLIDSLNVLISVNEDIVHKAKKISEGILFVKLDKRSDEDELMISLNNMVETLAKVMDKLIEASKNIATAGNEINTSAIQISQGSNEQSASSEEVSSSMEEMVSTINQNAENSKLAERMSINVDNRIEVVNKSVNDTTTAMQTIADKIKIINEIAEKTDLLAINAAIEAARAGEFGKGFSVVASEIRKLAENSNKAAIQIEDITLNSVKTAEHSYTLIQELTPELKKTTSLVQEISAASTEQLSNANQVNNALQQLSQVIQQNTASSEELAATSEEFVQQSNNIRTEINFFKIKDTEGETISELNEMLKKYTNEINVIKSKLQIDKVSTPQVERTHKSGIIKGVDFDMTEGDSEYEKY